MGGSAIQLDQLNDAMKNLLFAALAFSTFVQVATAAPPFGHQKSVAGIRHSFLIAGNVTAIVGEDGQIKWRTEGRARDAFVLKNGNVLVSVANTAKENAEKPKLFEVTHDKKVVWEFFHPNVRAHEVHVLTTNGKKEGSLK